MLRTPRIVVVGAGIGGLSAAVDLAASGCEVLVFERASTPGGKLRQIAIDGRPIDSGPTVFTMRWVLEGLFDDAGASLGDRVGLRQADVLARHAWGPDERLDLFSDIDKSSDAISDFAGVQEAQGYRDFCARAKSVYDTLEGPFIKSARPNPMSLAYGAGFWGLADLWRISPFVSLWHALGDHFRDPRLRQLFGRYATYCGSSPFEAPATLMLVAHVEREGVWLVDGGMKSIATAVATLAQERGAAFRYSVEVAQILARNGRVNGVRLATGEEVPCDGVVVNADVAAVADGIFGLDVAGIAYAPRSQRSLSAVTWSMLARTQDFPLLHHNVFFSSDYEAEFDDIFGRDRLPAEPTVYVCAEDRNDDGVRNDADHERLFALVNAPPTGDIHQFTTAEIRQCEERAFARLARCGLHVSTERDKIVATTPNDFDRMYRGTGGALYGQTSHGWTASFTRPTARTRLPGLYLAGGGTHPGPGVPMAALSGRLAAEQVLSNLGSTGWSPGTATFGGTSMR
jgi:1-hydroxycarotenoid 3,4-desaturase